MPKTSLRAHRVADLIKHQLGILIKKEIRDPRLSHLSITSVEMSADLSSARVYYTLLDKKDLESVQAGLEKATGYLRHLLAKNSSLKYTPKIHFIYDESVIAAEQLSRLIDQSLGEDDKPEHE